MAFLVKLAAIAALIAQGVVAAPWDPVSRHTTHRVRSVGTQGAKFQSYHPEPVFETYGVSGVDHPLTKRGVAGTPQEAAKAFLEEKLGVAPDALGHKSGHASDVVSLEYFRQKINNLPIANAVANVALKGEKVVSFGASFVKPKSVAPVTPKLTKEAAIAKAEAAIGGKYNNWPTSLEYFAKDSDHVVLTHVVQVQNDVTQEWYEAFVDATSGEIVNVVSFVADASYRVIPFTSQDPRDGFQLLTNPHDTTSSPNGWHQYGTTTTTTTSGNNVIAYKSSSSTGTTAQSSATNNYDYTFNSAGTPAANKNPATVNAFYVGNMMHDLFYRYGFTETAYNFQRNNNGKGGAQNDHVLISVQDSSGSNNANFATPADGQSGQMRMFTWTYTSPNRDGALENDIVVHEYTHGITNRLTGGGTGRCLQTTEAGGMGEGWSDAVADWTEQTSAAKAAADFTLGSYVYTRNIRDYPYSTSKTTNPLTYGSLRTRTEVHDAGEVWATIWHEIYAGLVAKLGFSTDKNNAAGTAGNIVALHLLVDALQLQPCNPTFISARNAIIQADANRYAGANKCTLWAAFAKRGLGNGATTTKTDSTTLPSGC
ncbi:extracellular metalloproteinase MEP [Ceratobasidium sp. AG-Ba]|nr:extracellular metalloproteinase MEP [Ceratobasidium sp. AG-Ba]